MGPEVSSRKSLQTTPAWLRSPPSTRGAAPTCPRRIPGPMSSSLETDLVIVGAGTAGCLLARRLIEQTSARVILLEAGPRYPGWALGAPLAGLRLRTNWSWRHQTVPQAALDHRQIPIPMGRVVGGTSSVNAMVAALGPPTDFDEWVRLGCEGWSADELAASLQSTGRSLFQPVLPVSPARFESPFSTAFLQACETLGLRHVEPFTGDRAQTCGLFPLFQQHGTRCTAAQQLVGLEQHPRFRLLTGQTVRRVLVERQQAVGVEIQSGRQQTVVRAQAGVILSAGALQTPALLQLSGVGPAALLRHSGIAVELDLPGVGQGLQDHVGAPVVIQSRAASPGRPSRWLQAAVQWLLGRSGVMTSNCCEAGCFLGPGTGLPFGEIFTHFQTRRHSQAVELMCALVRPASRGSVTIDPADPWGPPRIDPGYLTDPADWAPLRELVMTAREIAAQPALREFGLGAELLPGDQPLDEFLRRHASTCHHPVGSCRMGTDALAVVNPRLEVHGLRRLWLADNSIAPVIPRGHTAATALVIAEQGARLIARQLNGAAGGSPRPRREPRHCPTPTVAAHSIDAAGASARE